MTNETNTPEAMAAAAMERGTFRFEDMIRDRTYPEVTVPLYLDEARALRLVDAETRRGEVDNAIQVALAIDDAARLEAAQAEADELDVEIERLRDEMRDSGYSVTVRGFSMTTRRELVEKAFAEYPEEFEEISHPLTGRTERKAIENPERDRYFMDLMWHQYIIDISRADGVRMERMDVSDIAVFREMLPIISREYVQRAIDKVQVASDWYKGLVTEVF